MRKSMMLLLSMLLMLNIALAPQQAHAEAGAPSLEYTLSASADTWVQGGATADTNYGANDRMKVKRTSTENRDAFVKFDTSSVIGSVYEAELRVYVVSMESATVSAGGMYQIEIRGMSDDGWSEVGMTYANAPADQGTVLGVVTVTQSSVGSYVTADVTDFIKGQTDSTVSFRIRGVEASRGADYATKEHAFPPLLIVKAWQGAQPDTLPPTIPGTPQAEWSGPGSVTLTWQPSTDNSGTVTYAVYRDGAVRGTAAAASYTDTLLNPGSSYVYRVLAIDGSGNASPLSEPVTVTAPGRQLVTEAAADSYTRPGSGPFGSQTTMNVKSNSSGSDIRRAYMKFPIPEYSGMLEHAAVKLYVTALESSTPADGYDVTLYGIQDDSWQEGTITDANRPQEMGVPLGQFRVNADAVGTYITFPATEFVRGQTDGIASFYLQSSSGVSRGANYATKENALDKPPLLMLTIQELQTPAVPEGLAAVASSKRVRLTWNASNQATLYEVYRDNGSGFTLAGQTAGLEFTDTDVVNDTTYTYKVRARNAAFESDFSVPVAAMPVYPMLVRDVSFRTLSGDQMVSLDGAGFIQLRGMLENLTVDSFDTVMQFRILKSNADKEEVLTGSVRRTVRAGSIAEFKWSGQFEPSDSGYTVEVSVRDAANGLSEELYHIRTYFDHP
ncbi:CBM96 family carbohydrate-binding protein [Paenibacillus silviterrae]|uniref:CBM96 family carbohydrate-binding protein n=1 Tax=Paenibacillus silviterrae TaxID=3242194 RepID=UPI002542B2B7|nr:DNRLRE domain-containing protein [Paenibacillus chinjuensis]